MIIGKIGIDLDHLQYSYNAAELEIIHRYINENKEIETIRQLIEVMAKNELTLFTDEEFLYYSLYNSCEYNPVSEEQLQEFIKYKVIDPSKRVAPSYYANFLFVDGKCIDPATGQDIYYLEFTPCLIELSHHTMITYYIFEWYAEDGYFFEIEV